MRARGADTSGRLNGRGRDVLRGVDDELERGLALFRWWRREEREGREGGDRREILSSGRGHTAVALRWPRAVVPGVGTMPVLGLVQRFPYTGLKVPPGQAREAARRLTLQVREFALGYFLRVTSLAQAQSYPILDRLPLPPVLEMLSSCPAAGVQSSGVELDQVYFKRRGGRLGRFPARESHAIVDLRQLGPTYDWVLMSASLLSSSFRLTVSGPGSPSLVVPLERRVYLALCRHLVRTEQGAAGKYLGSFGPGFVYLAADPSRNESFLPAFETVRFRVTESGQVIVRMVFLCRQPNELGAGAFPLVGDPSGLVGATARPLVRSFDLASFLSCAARRSSPPARDGLDFLMQHSVEQTSMLFGSLQVFNLVADWLDPECIPEWVRRGRFSEEAP